MKRLLPLLLLFICFHVHAQFKPVPAVVPGAARTDQYLSMLQGKRVAVFANHTAVINSTHLVDSLKKLGVNIVKAFGPEHGFRGTADAGAKVDNYIDSATGIPVISLYGKKRKPTAEDLADVDVMVFDIQDVGVRFYTFISSLQEYVEAALDNNKPLIIMDRPNPNGDYVDGPVLDTAFRSFVGMQPVPVVYGMTIGEYAIMLAAENWLQLKSPIIDLEINAGEKQWHIENLKAATGITGSITIIPCKQYTHLRKVSLPVKPSPNLPDDASVFWYPSNCFFEGTVLSEGRGTDHPFCIFGHPSLPKTLYAFTPTARDGATNPKLLNQQCYGWNLFGEKWEVVRKINRQLQLKYLMNAYKLFPQKDSFFIRPKSGPYFFDKLAGTDKLRKQIIAGKSEAEIRRSWQPQLNAFKKIRKKYLLYPEVI